MKNLLLIATLAFVTPVFAQDVTNPPPIVVPSAPVPAMTFTLGDISASNITFAAVAEYAPALPKSDQWGAKIAALYPVSDNVYTGFWVDYFGNSFTLGTIGVTLKADMTVFKWQLTPYLSTGANYVLNNNGTVGGSLGGTIGAGLTVTVYRSKHIDVGVIGGYERTSVFNADIYQFGPRLTWKF